MGRKRTILRNSVQYMKGENMKRWYEIIDDKFLVIICATALAGAAMFMGITPESVPIVTGVVSGLFGVAVGKSL